MKQWTNNCHIKNTLGLFYWQCGEEPLKLMIFAQFLSQMSYIRFGKHFLKQRSHKNQSQIRDAIANDKKHGNKTKRISPTPSHRLRNKTAHLQYSTDTRTEKKAYQKDHLFIYLDIRTEKKAYRKIIYLFIYWPLPQGLRDP